MGTQAAEWDSLDNAPETLIFDYLRADLV